MSLQDEIRGCQRCSLFNTMETSPVPPEWTGSPQVMFIIDVTISMDVDFAQTPLTGATRLRFIQLIEKYFKQWYITPLIKCGPKNLTYSVGDYKICTKWIEDEVKRLNPKFIVGCGSKVEKYFKCNYYTMSPVRITQSQKHELLFEDLLMKIKENLNV